MCSIVGAVLRHGYTLPVHTINAQLSELWANAHERGRDGRGFILCQNNAQGTVSSQRSVERRTVPDIEPQMDDIGSHRMIMIGNTRAEPTTEYVLEKRVSDQQPYRHRGWNIVHNGTIANDKDLRTWQVNTDIDSAAIAEVLGNRPADFMAFEEAIRSLKGSFAILAFHDNDPGTIYAACNYRPIWYIATEMGYFFASSRNALPVDGRYVPQMLKPYSIARFLPNHMMRSSLLEEPNSKALVVCSGGLDSVVSAAWAQANGYDIELIHFQYGSRAEGPEVRAVQAVAEALRVPVTLFPLPVYRKQDSPLLDADSKVAGGEAGAEFAHEWVPARNLLLLSVATAFAEARGIETLVLGNNLEEAGAYPDNEPEFIDRFNDMLPFAVGDGKQMRVVMPVGNMMKHEIVQLGDELGAPMHLTWSCYRAGSLHCGTCGPCYMRRKAFEINGFPEVITYQN